MTRMSAVLAVLLCAACANTRAPQPEALEEIGYEIVRPGHFVVPVSVNGEGPFRFFVDTAATRTVIFDRMRRRFGLEPLAGETRLVKSAFGESLRPAYRLRELTIGNQRFENYETTTLTDGYVRQWEPDGALGIDILSRYHMAFFHGRRALVLYDNSRPMPENFRNWTSIPVKADSLGLVYLAVEVNNRLMLGLLDLGSNNNIMNEAAARLVGQQNSARFMRRTTLIDTFSNEYDVPVSRSNAITIASIRFRNQDIAIAPPGFLDPAFDDIPIIVIGGDVLSEADFAMDFTTPRFLLNQSSLVQARSLAVHMRTLETLREQQRILDSLEIPAR